MGPSVLQYMGMSLSRLRQATGIAMGAKLLSQGAPFRKASALILPGILLIGWIDFLDVDVSFPVELIDE